MGWCEGDRAAGEHDEREGGVGAVESVGAARDLPVFVVSASVRPWLIPSRMA